VTTDYFKIACDITNEHAAKLRADPLGTAKDALIGALRELQRREHAADVAQGRVIDAEQVVKLAEAEVARLQARRAGDVVKP
jgi:hypothetical protein